MILRSLAPLRRLGAVALLFVVLGACSDETPPPFEPTADPTPAPPRELTITAIDRSTDAPMAGVALVVAGQLAQTDADGAATITAFGGDDVAASAPGFDPASAEVPDSGDLIVELRSNVVRGTVIDADGAPIEDARVFVDGGEAIAYTDADGAYELGGVPEEGTLIYKMPGHRLGEIAIDEEMVKDVVLPPFAVRALYSPSAVFEAPGRLDEMLALLDATEANAMVIDVKETGGYLFYSTQLPSAVESGAIMEQPIFDLEELLPQLKERGIYTIARMVVMKDNTVGATRPELAVRNTATGGPWTDNIGGIWLDPAAPGVAEYVASIAGDLADKGFDEVQLDYIRFFSDGPYDLADTNLPNSQSFRLPAIRRVMRLISDELEHRRAFLSAAVFPVSFIASDDQGIGQRPEVIMPYVDYFSPMVYPSHYGPGVFGFDVPNEYPYEVIDETLQLMNEQAEGLPMVIRPWIQDFGYGPFRAYGVADVKAEMQAAADNGAMGWMIWNAQARFTEAALDPPRENEDAGPIMTAAPTP